MVVKGLMRAILAVACCLAAYVATAEPVQQKHFGDGIYYGGAPVSKTPDDIQVLKNHDWYAVGYSKTHREAAWVAYSLGGKRHHAKVSKRPGNFRIDVRVGNPVPSSDYDGTGYDRGHMAANQTMAEWHGHKAQYASFLMSNVVPQTPECNRGIWKRIEERERGYPDTYGTIWVICGPVFSDHPDKLAGKSCDVPDAFFRIIVREDAQGPHAMALVVPQHPGSDKFEDFSVSVNSVESSTGLDVMSELPKETQSSIEGAATKPW